MSVESLLHENTGAHMFSAWIIQDGARQDRARIVVPDKGNGFDTTSLPNLLTAMGEVSC